MAKKSARIILDMKCSACKNENYTTYKNKTNTQTQLKLNKFCSRCKKVTEHVEVK